MSTQRGKKLLIAGGVASLVVIAAIAALLLFDINTFKSNIESAAFDATGLEVKIKGKLGLYFFPFGVSAQDIHVTGTGGEIISAENLKLGAELMPLLKKQLKATRCELIKPHITIVKDGEGRYNFESAENKSTKWGRKAVVSLNELKLSKGVFVYLDKNTGGKTDLKDFNLSIKGLSIENLSEGILKSASFTGTFDCKEVLRKGFRIENLRTTVKAVKGKYNFAPLTIGALANVDSKSGEKTELLGINLAVRDLSVVNTPGEAIQKISFTGDMDCKEVRKKDFKINNVKSSVKAEKGVFHLKPFTMDIFGAKGEGDATLDTSETDVLYKINLKISRLDFEKFGQAFGIKKVIGGKGDLVAAIALKEKGSRMLMSSLDGTFSLRGDNLVIYSMDLDKVLSKYETSQEFNLVDLGAFFIAGPLSTFAVRGYRAGDLYNQTRGGNGAITHFNSHWKIKRGVADAVDCALATQHNRVALKGRLDLVSERYDNVIVALLDDKGCAKFKQSISGPFRKPRISALSAAESLAGPFSHLYTKARRFVQGGKCEVLYNGSVQQPPK
ncbi:MAG: AsmA family protein [Desulfuromonadaceae bacterium]